MLRPNFIPRTLLGVGGARLFNIPGVVYPKEMLITKAGFNHKDGKPYTDPPLHWGITTNEAARLLGSTPSAARSWLHRHKIPFRIVCEEGQVMRLFWRKQSVLKHANMRLPVLSQRSEELVDSAETLRILGVGRSTLYRYEQRGQLNVVKVRISTSRGMRTCSFYKRAEVEHLADYITILRSKEADISCFRHRHRPTHVIPSMSHPTHSEFPVSKRKPRRNKKCK